MTSSASKQTPLTGWRVLAIAGPVVLSNAAAPLQGAIDTAIVGHLDAAPIPAGALEVAAPLAAVGLGAEILAVLLSSFNFLQIGVSGLSAQALGRADRPETARIVARGLVLGAAIGAAMILLQSLIIFGGLALFEATAATEALAGEYVAIRIWGAPAELMLYSVFGCFAGQELTRNLFTVQVATALLNVALNLLFAVHLGWGVAGVALGTVVASYAGLALGLALIHRRLAAIAPLWRIPRAELLEPAALRRLFMLNRDLFIRTLLLVLAVAWMARLGSLQGDAVLAANVVLWQFFLVSAYGLDGFAIAAETLVGQSIGARNRRGFDRSILLTTIWSFGLAAVVSIGFLAFSGTLISAFTDDPQIRSIAGEYAFWACLIPLVGVAAFELDGVFVGATASAAMRNGMILSTALYIPISLALADAFANHGVWAAVWIWLLLRAATLAAMLPRLRADATDPV